MSEHANILDESTEFRRDIPEKKPFRAKKAKLFGKSGPDEYEKERKPVKSRPTKELSEDPPPLSDAPTGEIPRELVERARKMAKKARES